MENTKGEIVSLQKELSITRRALELACDRVADSGQTFEEAKTEDGWYDHYIERAKGEVEADKRN